MIGIVILSLLILIFIFKFMYNTCEHFSSISEDISDGNPISWSKQSNRYVDMNLKYQQPILTSQGFGHPLLHEDHIIEPVKDSMFYFDRTQCHPSCCPYSSYSCSHGCVCWNRSPYVGIDQNDKISPRS